MKTMSLYFRRAPISGPISLSVDLFPSHNLDVKICVHTLEVRIEEFIQSNDIPFRLVNHRESKQEHGIELLLRLK